MKNKFAIFFLVVIVPALISCASAGNGVSAVPERPDAPAGSAMAFVRDMGIGINIGNTLDAIGTETWIAGETGWGNPEITPDFIQALKNYGFTTIRLPVTWAEYIGPGPDFIIEEGRMSRVEEVVNWILGEGLYCVLNLHHDGGTSDRSWILKAADDPDGITKQFASVWNQIARRFADASHNLVFEAMNEVGFSGIWDQWNPATKDRKPDAYRILNNLNQTFVDTVRASGGNNGDRFLLVSGYWTDIDLSCDPLFKMPRDTGTAVPRRIG